MFSDSKIAMIILAAGLSKRMSVFKPLLPTGDLPAVVRCVRAAETAGVRDIIVVTGHKRDELESVLLKMAPHARTVFNSRFSDGMFSSVRAGVSALTDDTDGFFILPSDCCAVTGDMLAMLIWHFEKAGGLAVTRPKFNGQRGHPPLIPAVYIAPLLSYNGDNGLKGFLSPLPTLEIEMENNAVLLDMDTPSDYAALLDHMGLPGYPSPALCKDTLARHGASEDIIRHGEQVASIALELSRGLDGLNLDLLESACLLHDIKRAEPNHAHAGMVLLLKEGYPKTALLIGGHMDLPDMPGQIISELELLYLADKLCRRDKYVPLEETALELEAKYSSDAEALASAKRRIDHALIIRNRL